MNIRYITNARMPTEKAHGLQIVKMCEAFAKEGHEVTLVKPWRFNNMRADVYEFYKVERNFNITSLPSLDVMFLGYIGFWIQHLTFSISVFVYALTHSRDVFYSRDEMPLFAASFVATRIFWESHTGRYDRLIARLLRRVSGLVVITNGLRDLYAGKGFPVNAITIAPDAVALEDFKNPQSPQDARARLGLPQDKKIALYIGRLDGWKGIGTFLDAAALLSGDITVAVIGGEPHQVAALRAKHPRVIFLGPRPYRELADNQSAADVLVLPNTAADEISVRYTSPLKLFTYLVSNRPVILSDLPSLREVVSDAEGYFFKPDDADSLAAVIRHVFSHQEEAEAKAVRAHSIGRSYTWTNRAVSIMRFITERLSGTPHA